MNAQLYAYKRNQINTASSEDLVLMLYDGAIKFIKKAIRAIDEKNIQEANDNFIRAQKILTTGLMTGINFEAGEIAHNLYSLYEYMHRRLVQANMKKDAQAAAEVLAMVEELRMAWSQILKSRGGKENESGNEKMTAIS